MRPLIGLLMLVPCVFAQQVDLTGELRLLAPAQEWIELTEWRTAGAEKSEFTAKQNQVTWLQTTVEVPSWWVGQKLAFAPGPVPAAYEIVADGQLVGRYGSLDPSKPEINVPKHASYILPASRPRVTIGVRMLAVSRSVPAFLGRSRTRYSHPPLIGLATAITQREELEDTRAWIDAMPVNLLWATVGACGVLCLWLFRKRRQEIEILWLGLALTCNGAARLLAVPMAMGWIASNSLAAFGLFWTPFLLVHLFYCLLLAELLPRGRGLIRAAAFPIAFLSVWPYWQSFFLVQPSIAAAAAIRTFALAVQCALGVIAAIVNFGPRRWDFVALGLSVTIRAYTTAVSTQTQTPSAVANVMVAVSIVSILYLRFQRRQRAQADAERDLEAASRVQSALLGVPNPVCPGFEIENAYYPARQVGGDFYYFAPSSRDGSLLVVVGDVSGKGLEAAMLVASILGSLRNEDERSPSGVLARLNRSVAGNTGTSFVTCCCARFDGDGVVTIANAGHLAPYCNGQETFVESGLPLGITTDTSYAETVCSGSRFTFLSDGVVEATNKKGELFGFERAQAVSAKPAGEIGNAAQTWGQTDDITVVTIRRAG